MERPTLKHLLADAGRIDVVVYTVNRLTRSRMTSGKLLKKPNGVAGFLGRASAVS